MQRRKCSALTHTQARIRERFDIDSRKIEQRQSSVRRFFGLYCNHSSFAENLVVSQPMSAMPGNKRSTRLE